jgi:hypothetical protein
MIIKCKDGDLQVPEMLLEFNPTSRCLCNDPTFIEAAKSYSMTDVFNKLNNPDWE